MFESIVSFFEDFANSTETFVWGTPAAFPWLIVMLLGTGAFLSIRMGLIQLRRVGHAIQIVRGKYDDPSHAGDISHFQALTTALSATVGIGNIAGVAFAIHYGGPGAIFWMWVTALLGMCTKYVEVSLAMKYRDFDAKGNSSGGPQKYILKGLGANWKPVAMFFAFCAILSSLCAGNMNQINTLADAVHSTTDLPFWLIGAICTVLVGSVILGGIQRIGKVTSVLMPLMAVIYVVGALVVLTKNASALPGTLGTIVQEAFNPTAGFAGTAAGVWSMTLLWGVKRGLFSNEAGQGSAPIAHAAAKTDVPLREGLVALLEPFIDTLIICTMTALVVLTSGIWDANIREVHGLGHKDLKVMTWPEGQDVSLKSFGRFAGLRGDRATIEEAGFAGATGDGSFEGADAVDEMLVVKVLDGKTRLFVRHDDGSQTGAILVKNDAPVIFADGHGIRKGSALWEGEVRVKGGHIVPEDATGVDIEAGMVKAGQALTAEAFERSLGGVGLWVVTITVILFALSTAISWSYYGDRCAEFLFGIKGVVPYRLVFLTFVFLGAMLKMETVWKYGDIALGVMTVPNLIALIILSREVRAMQDDYFSKPQPPRR